jgi:hypothetical protein
MEAAMRFIDVRRSALALLLCGAAGAASAQAVATLTMTEKPARIVRGAAVYKAVAGTIVQKDDLIETGDGAAQVEAPGGAIFALGPQTRVHVSSLAMDARTPAELQLLQGWVKLASKSGARAQVWTGAFQASFGSGALIVSSKPGKDALFADEGEQLVARLDEKGKPGAPVKVPPEQFAFALAGQALVVQPRPARDFLSEMPPAFRDRLSTVPASVKGARLPASKEREADFADVAPWLTSSLPVRKSFVARFRARLKDPQFRSQLEQALGKDSEWKAVLNPAAPKPAQENNLY